MKHLSKKLISSLLLCAVIAGAASCADDPGQIEDSTAGGDITSADRSEPTRLDELGARDFGQKTFTILDANSQPTRRSNIPSDEQSGEMVNDALFNRDTALEERFNVRIEYESISDRTGHTAFKNSVLAGDDDFQMTYNRIMSSLAPLVTDGVLVDLTESKHLSLDREWWSPLMYENIRLNGKMYFTTGDILPSMYQLPSALFYNTDLAADYGIQTDVVGMVREGQWTLDEIYNMTKDMTTDVNNDGKMTAADDFYGIVNDVVKGISVSGWFTGAGVKLAEITPDAKGIKVDMGNEQALDVLEKVQRFFVTDFTQDGGQDFLIKTFAEDRALFAAHFVESASAFLRNSGMESDYLIVPMPKYDEKQETYVSLVNPWIEAFVGISSITDLEFAGFMAEAMAYYSYENIRPLAWDMTYGDKLSRSEDTAEMLDIIFETSYLDFNVLYEFGSSIQTSLVNAVKGASLTTELAKVEGKIESDIEKLIKNWG